MTLTSNTDHDDSPYAERDDVALVYTVSAGLRPVGRHTYVYLDGANTRLARQLFHEDQLIVGYGYADGAVSRWLSSILEAVLLGTFKDHACGDCGNLRTSTTAPRHAPDCVHFAWNRPTR